jgi:hypothetical protein
MQHPVGYHLNKVTGRAEMTSLRAILTQANLLEADSQCVGLAAVLLHRDVVAQPRVGDQPVPRIVRRSPVANQVFDIDNIPLPGHRLDRFGEPRHPVQDGRHDRNAHAAPCKECCGSRL